MAAHPSNLEHTISAQELDPQDDDQQFDSEENVQVMLRCRPLLSTLRERQACVQIDENQSSISTPSRQFHFDAVFGPETGSEQVYMRSVRRLVESAFRGFSCTAFLYGQTGTGKTHTHSALSSLAFEHLFGLIHQSSASSSFLIRASYYELYNEEIRDLLAAEGSKAAKSGKTTEGKQPKAGRIERSKQQQQRKLSTNSSPLELKESRSRGVYVEGLSWFLVRSVAELERLKRLGDKQRATAATRMNERSSRSHSILTLVVEAAAPTESEPTPSSTRVGRLNLIDLAGSERQAKSGSQGARLREAAQINLSLTCLSLVIRALTDKGASHVPYRNSKLTRLLSSSLGGDSKTLLIGCISPSNNQLDETMNTLSFASRTKQIKNRPRLNEDAKDALLRRYRRQVELLRQKLRQRQELKQNENLQSNERKTDLETMIEAETEQVNELGERQALDQLRLLRAKIVVGGENLLEKVELHEKLLEASRQELEDRRQKEISLRDRLEQGQANLERLAQSKGSVEEQKADLDRKLKKALQLYRAAKEQRREMISEHEELKYSLLDAIKGANKEISYADCIISDFIPADQLELINDHAHYDEQSNLWQIKYIALSGNNVAQTNRMASVGLRRNGGINR